jgi:hypothetical protein
MNNRHRDESFVWTPSDIMREFNLGKSAVFAKLKEAGLTGGAGEYCTSEVCRALYGDLKVERTALVRAQKEEQEMRVLQMKGVLVDLRELEHDLAQVFVAMRGIIAASDLPKRDSDDILKEISRITVVVRAASDRSRALVGGKRLTLDQACDPKFDIDQVTEGIPTEKKEEKNEE